MSGTNDNPLSYDSTYGGIVTANSVENFASDFGSGWYNDHHFHYGYIIYAAAAIAKIDATYFADPAKKVCLFVYLSNIRFFYSVGFLC